MNCQQLALILDEQELHQLPADARRTAEAHLAGCPDCARDHAMHLRLAALPVPPASPAMLAGWRTTAVAMAGRSARPRNRFIVIGSTVALAAAASMLVWYLKDSPDTVVTMPPASAPVQEPGPLADPPVSAAEEMAEPAGDEMPIIDVPINAPPPAPAFTVLVRPLVQDTDDPHARDVADQYYTTLLQELRANPALRVVVASDIGKGKLADLRLIATSTFGKVPERFGNHEAWNVSLTVETPLPDGSGYGMVTGVSADPQCGLLDPATIPADSLCSGSGLARSHLQYLYQGPFVHIPDPVLEKRLLGRFRDPNTPADVRLSALQRLVQMRRQQQQPLEAELTRAVLEQYRLSADPTVRRNMLGVFQNQRDAGLAGPLVEMARLETDDVAREHIVTLLAMDHADLPEVRSALVSIASTEQKPLIRKIAERAVSGDAAWRDYVVATITDSTLPSEQKFAPLAWMADTRARWRNDTRLDNEIGAVTRELLDRGQADALADVLQQAGKGPNRMVAIGLQGMIGAVQHPGVVDLLLDMSGDAPDISLVTLLGQHRDDPRAKARLQYLAANHPVPELRDMAARQLQNPP